ncbi:NAD(P)-binding protein [Xylaria venustula]|nr:NAD(P)-binding protein [Xylaria venustula]
MPAPSKLGSLFSQYYPPKPTFTEAQLTPGSQSGRVFIVTGGNTGIGFELCKLLIRTGATIYMASRSKEKAEAAIKTISDSIPQETPGKGLIKFLRLDLNDLRVVQEAAKEFARQESRLDVLWNNAGTGGNAVTYGERTAQDLEPLMGMHCVATLLFSELLRPLLQAAAADNPNPGATRVLWLASNLVETSAPNNGIDFAKMDRGYENGATNYAASKAGTWMLAREYGRRYAKDGILSLTVNPGNVKAGSYAGTPWPIMAILNATMLHETTYGAYTELYAGLSPDLKPEDYVNFIIPWGRVGAIDVAWRQDIVKAMRPKDEGGLGYGRRLWEWCEEQWKPHVVDSS